MEYLLANTVVVLEQSKTQSLSNPTGYLLKALQNDYRPVQNGDIQMPLVNLIDNRKEENTIEVKTKDDRTGITIQDQIDEICSKAESSEIEKMKTDFIKNLKSKDVMRKVLESK